MPPNPPAKTQSDDDLYVSPTSDETVQARYATVQAHESGLTNAERLAALRNTPSLFDDESDQNNDEA